MTQTGTGGWRTLARQALRERTEQAAGAVLDGTERLGSEIEEAADATADGLDGVLGLASPQKVG